MKSISLFGSGVNSYSKVATSQRRVNCFYDIRADGDKTALILRGTPGSVSWITLPTSPIRGWRTVGNLLYVVSGRILLKVTTAGVATQLGVLATSTGIVVISDNSVQLCMTDGTNGYVYTITTGSYAQSALNAAGSFGIIADANFPISANAITFINGRLLANLANSRQVFGSYSYDATNWGATAPASVLFFTKENNSDNLLSVEVFQGNIILWGVANIEFWQDVGGATLPYQRVTGSTQTYGLAAVQSTAVVANMKIFVANVPGGGWQICALNGYVPTAISTPDIDHIINSFTTVSDAMAMNYIFDGHDMYQVTFPTGGRSFLYDTISKTWQEVQTGLAAYGLHYARYCIVFNNINYTTDSSTGTIYQMSGTMYTDNGKPILRQAITKHIRNGGNVIGISELLIDMDTGEGLQAGQGSKPALSIETSKDGGRTYGMPRQVSIGVVGSYRSRVIARRFGMSRDFVFRLTMTDPIPFIITDASVTMFGQEGGNV